MKYRVGFPGEKYGRLTILSESDHEFRRNGQVRRRCLCQCECGSESVVRLDNLRSGQVLSCGCLRANAIAEALTTHGLSKTAEYKIWKGMKSRCNNKNNPRYKYYGGRGISISDKWMDDFPAFLSDVGLRPSASHSIDRINNNGNYEPGNCRWAVNTQQGRNQRLSSASTTGLKGVSVRPDNGRFRVRIRTNSGTRKHIGFFGDFFEAACARKSAEAREWRPYE